MFPSRMYCGGLEVSVGAIEDSDQEARPPPKRPSEEGTQRRIGAGAIRLASCCFNIFHVWLRLPLAPVSVLFDLRGDNSSEV